MTHKSIILIVLLIVSLHLSAQVADTAKPKAITAADLDYRKDNGNYLLVLRRGQPVMASLVAFMAKEKLLGASISAIGAVENAEVAYYDVKAKHYKYTKFEPSMEVLSLNGNMGYFDNKPMVHAHISMADSNYTVHGGHLKEATVSLILEVFITPTSKPITREWNKDFPELRTMKTIKE